MRELQEEFTQGVDICCKKNKDYGDAKNQFGKLMMILLPKGLILTTAAEMNEFAIFTELLKKITRFANLWRANSANFESVDDTLLDLGNYAFILKNMIHNNKKCATKKQ